MARNRQRSKQRQQERREQRLTKRAAEGDKPAADEEAEKKALEEADLEVGAPPQDLGTSEATLASEAGTPDVEVDPEHLEESEIAEEEEYEEEHPDDFLDEEHPEPARKRRGHPDHGRTREHGRVIGFLVNVWAELQRVQWPDRQAVTTLTGVVLGFVLIAGGYLGLLDAIFSRVIKAIL